MTCYQGAEYLPNCTHQSILYENVCTACVPGAGKKEQVKEEELRSIKEPAIYIGETSRSIQERSLEHWKGYTGSKKDDNHMYRHQLLVHGGEQAKFTMKVEGSHRTALSRKVSEAVRIRRRGGEHMIQNSKAEYNRCHIPRLRVEQEEEVTAREEQQKRAVQKAGGGAGLGAVGLGAGQNQEKGQRKEENGKEESRE